MPTELLYLDNTYGKECESTCTMVEFTDLVVDKSIFYPTSFGQPNDRGTVIIDGKSFEIVDTWIDGLWVHLMSHDTYPQDIVGKKVSQKINWDLRYSRMRFRGAMFLISGIAYNEIKCTSRINQTYDDQSWVDLITDGDLTEDIVRNIEEKANQMVSAGLPITTRYITREEFGSNPDSMFLNKNQIPDYDRIRVTEIEGLPSQFDMGTQVANTSEIGKVTIKTTQIKGKLSKRLVVNLIL
ncbi:MAG: alanyl-tRNA editing protein [Candidatus Thermoplasmatota archaeon]|nr:alanyl-tRNA editing protein [Candidatus Thermoplasmatota archaeon]MCL5730848.1 alanyl-tRNA editing protein [Candidatus Thermoplasmatota archaeon]